MYITQEYEKHIISDVYNEGYRYLKILSGQVSPLLVEQILDKYKELHLKIYVGLVSTEGISQWTHLAFQHLVRRYSSRLEIYFQASLPGNHSNIYYWENPLILGLDHKIFIGSASFTLNSFYHRKEIMIMEHSSADEVFSSLDVINCTSPNVSRQIDIHQKPENELNVSYNNDKQLDLYNLSNNEGAKYEVQYIDIPLTIRGGDTPPKSGINWGHNGRNGLRQSTRTGNEAYLSISNQVHKERPNFLPQRGEKILILTDDEKMFVCVVAQEHRKAIQTCDNNSILGAYIRERIDVPSGTYVETKDLIRYGRDSIRLSKIHEGLYVLNFDSQLTLNNCEEYLWNLEDRETNILHKDAEKQVLIESIFIRVPQLNIDVYGGFLALWDEKEEDYFIDSDLIIIKDIDTDEVLHEEGGSPLIASVSNYCNSIDLETSMEVLQSLECEIITKNILSTNL
ncbi:NgoFVII family restriction endonuclease [Lysinibacillus xylanilyticus]|uniref:restriction endonuclease PLD domain-containing protein n=1 Tax=Lysinibacillus xylanilyticus TaxID=582475 RepID=UPI002E1D7C43|nr:NgoFVII family restriction endonuclease [Lysinibacillus xylanilyticus]